MTYNERACREIIAGIGAVAPTHLIAIPCSTVGSVISHFEDKPRPVSLTVTREEEAFGIASGLALGGQRPLLLLQDTGLGNSLLALTTFCAAYHVPMLVLVTRRGGLAEINSAVHRYSEHLPDVLDAAGVKVFRLDYRVPLLEWATVIQQAAEHAQVTHRPIIVMFNIKGGAEA